MWAAYIKEEGGGLFWESARDWNLPNCAAIDEYWANAKAHITNHLPKQLALQAGGHRYRDASGAVSLTRHTQLSKA